MFNGSETYIAAMFRGGSLIITALKLSNRYASQLNKEGMLQELKALQRLSSDTSLPLAQLTHRVTASVRLLTHLYHQGIEADGEHLYLVTYGTADIQYIRASLPNYGYLALPTVKRILRDVLPAIACALRD